MTYCWIYERHLCKSLYLVKEFGVAKGKEKQQVFLEFSTISVSPDKILAVWPEAFLKPLPTDVYGDLRVLGEHLCGCFIAAIKSEFLSLLACISSCCPSLFQKININMKASPLVQFQIFLPEILCSRFFCRVGHCNVSNTSLQKSCRLYPEYMLNK